MVNLHQMYLFRAVLETLGISNSTTNSGTSNSQVSSTIFIMDKDDGNSTAVIDTLLKPPPDENMQISKNVNIDMIENTILNPQQPPLGESLITTSKTNLDESVTVKFLKKC